MNNILSPQKTGFHSLQKLFVKNGMNKTFLFLIGCFISFQSFCQSAKNVVLGNQYFAAGDYFTAAGLYEQYLHPSKKDVAASNFPLNIKNNRKNAGSGMQVNKMDILYKQAESYRLANYFTEASTRYKECFDKDPAKYAAGLYWYAVCQRSLGNYALAEESINTFLSTYAAGNPFQQAAEKELQTIKYSKTQITRPDTVLYHIQKANASVGVEKGMYAPAYYNGNQFLVTSTQKDSVVSVAVNPFHNRLFSAKLADGSLQSIEPVQIQGVDVSLNQGAASLSTNGNILYLTQWKKENGKNISSVYYSAKNESGWNAPVLLTSLNQEGYSSKQPFCSADGKYLFFSSNRPGGSGNFDIWYALLQPDGTTAVPVNAGSIINSVADEQAPFYHSTSGTLIFSSNGREGMGGYDLFSAKINGTDWGNPTNMGFPVNSSRDDIYFFAFEKAGLLNNAIFSSDRGSECCLESYIVSKDPKKKTLTGIVRDLTDNLPVANAVVILKDGTGKTWKEVTGTNGSYTFNLMNEGPYSLNITKEYYKEKNTTANIQSTDESDWATDKLKNNDEFIEKRVILRPETVVTVYFDFDKYNLKKEAVEKLDSVYNVLVETEGATLQISGYTDGLGTVEYNKLLSDRRARACYQYLVDKGIDSSRITFESFGACCPLEMELINGRDNAEGRAKNRRALINVVMPKQE